jgi:tetratricopeptide (TPR) repeat protein
VEVSGIERASFQGALREAVTEQVLVTDQDGSFRFRHALLREVVYEDLLPGERGDLHLTLARLLEARMAEGEDQEAELAAAVAGHYAAAGDQRAALRAAVQAALAARSVHAYSEAAELAARALELWPRVRDAADGIPLTHVDLLNLAALSHRIGGDRARAEVLIREALREFDSAEDPRGGTELLAELAHIQWSLNRGDEAVETAQRALSLLPVDESSRERALLMSWLARTRFLRGKFRVAEADGEAALAAAVDAGYERAEGEVLNTLGMTRIALGSVDEGVALLERAIEIARQAGDLNNLGYAYVNLVDMLGVVGRTAEALQIAREGLASVPARVPRLHDWMMLAVAQLAFEAGDWKLMHAHLDAPVALLDRRSLLRLVLQAEVAPAEGQDADADRALQEADPLVAMSTEPQWIGWFGALAGELHRRRYELPAGRRAVEDALGRLEVCTDDVMQIARVSAVGARVEADLARRARDLRERAEEREALARLRIHLSRLSAAAQEGGPVERAWQAVGKAEQARARARSNPALWRAAARQWDAIHRPYQTAVMRWREAEAAVEAGDRPAAIEPARSALEIALRLGALACGGDRSPGAAGGVHR